MGSDRARLLAEPIELEDGSGALEGELDLQWSKIDFPDLQDLLFSSDSESESEDELSAPRNMVRQLKHKVKVTWETFGSKKWEIFKNNRMNAETDLRALAELEQHWSQVTPQEFAMTLYALGPEAKQADYLNSLLVEVDPLLLPRKQQKHVHNITMLFSCTRATWSKQKTESTPFFSPKRPGIVVNCSPCCEDMVDFELCGVRNRGLEVVHRFAYSTVTSLFVTQDPCDQVYVLKALVDAGRPSLGTPMGRALLLNRWLTARWEILFEKSVDVFYLAVFLWALVKIRHGVVPSAHTIKALMAVSVWTLITKAVEIAAALKLWKSVHVLSTSRLLMLIEVFNACTVLFFLYRDLDHAGLKCDENQGCRLMSHLSSLSLSIFVKWAHIISSMLCLKFLGQQVLPAAYTMFSAESVRFLFVISILIVASFNAYCAFPIPGTVPRYHENTPTWNYLRSEFQNFEWRNGTVLVPETTFNMMLSMFELDLMGDFDSMALEGQNPVIKLNGTVQKLVRLPSNASRLVRGLAAGSIIAPITNREIHQGVSLLLIVLCLFVNVMIMNIYIGLLSSVYEKYSAKRWELLAEYKTIHVLRAKLSNPFNLLAYFNSTRKIHRSLLKWWPFIPYGGERAIWFAFRNEEFPELESERDTAAVLGYLEDIRRLVDGRT